MGTASPREYKYIADYRIAFAGGVCMGSSLLPGHEVPEAGDTIRLSIRGRLTRVRVESACLRGEFFGVQHVELVCSIGGPIS
jgi:hypothetical protein